MSANKLHASRVFGTSLHCTHTQVYAHTHIQTCTHVHTHVHIHKHMNTCMCTYCTYIHTPHVYTLACTHTCICAGTNIHTTHSPHTHTKTGKAEDTYSDHLHTHLYMHQYKQHQRPGSNSTTRLLKHQPSLFLPLL